jgi:hypothetical protein
MVAEEEQGLPKELKDQIKEFFKKNPEQAGIFAARCALRALPACIGDNGTPRFSETPEKHLFAVIRASLYAWLWRSPGFPSGATADAYADADAYAVRAFAFAAAADAAYAARAAAFAAIADADAAIADAADAADAADTAAAEAAAAEAEAAAADAADAAATAAAEAAAAEAEAAAAEAAAAEAVKITGIEADFQTIQKGENIQFHTLFQPSDKDSKEDAIERDFGQKIQTLYGYGIANFYSCIIQGGETAKIVFNNSNQVYDYCEAIWKQLEAGSFQPDEYEIPPTFLNYEELRDTKKQSEAFNNNESSEKLSDQKIELIKQYIAGNKFSAEMVSSEDYLNRQPLADAVMKWLTEEENTSNINLALFGEWGVGKSTFLNMLIKSDLENKENSRSEKNKSNEATNQVHLIWGEFNAWRYEHSDNIQAGITQEAVKALKSQLGWLGRCWLTINYAFKSHPVQLVLLSVATIVTIIATGVAGYFGLTEKSDDLTTAAIAVGVPFQLFVFWFLYQKAQGVFSHPLADKLNTYLRLPSFGEHLGSIPVMREQVALLTQLRFKIPSLIATEKRWWTFGLNYRKSGQNQRLIFIVDDLDRCSPEGVVKTLEAIRLVMELDNVVVIIAIDQRVALASLAKHYEPLEKHHLLDAHEIARDYLAKVIHIPIVLEQPSENDIGHYLTNHLWKNDGTDQSEQNPKIGSDEASDGVSADVEAKRTTETKEENKAKETTEETTEETSEPPHDSNREEANMSDSDRSRPADKENPSEVGKPAQNFVEITGLSQDQKTLFLKSVQQLGLSNPRQLKRLDNCYSLLRLRYPDEDVQKKYYRLRMLIWLEYLHEQPSSLRCQFLNDWEQGRKFSLDSVNADTDSIAAINHWNAIVPALPQSIQQTIYREVRCFILPAVNVLASVKRTNEVVELLEVAQPDKSQ